MEIETVYKVPIKDIDFKNMPNDEEYYFTIDIAYNKKVHRCGYIKSQPAILKYVLLDKSQLTDKQLSALDTKK